MSEMVFAHKTQSDFLPVPSQVKIGAPGDAREHEADRMANELMSGATGAWSLSRIGIASPLQRKCSCGGSGGECEDCRTEKNLQRKSAHTSATEIAPGIVREVLKSPGQPLDGDTRAFFESRFQHDFSKVRIHQDVKAAESAQELDAAAYTVGSHVSFGTGLYRPSSIEGRQLIAHELAHVVQQSQHSVGDSAGESPVQPVLQRQQRGGSHAATQPIAPNARQQHIIEDARRAAAIRCQVAMFRVRNIVPAGPAGATDPATELAVRVRSLAQTMFRWQNPNIEQIGEVVSSMVNYLTSRTQVMIAGAGDSECGQRAAYVRGHRPPIVLCPAFFSESPEQRIRTMIHESAHLARIGNADLGESYCVDFDCVTSCGGFDSADSWAHFVHCLSNQAPDKPTTITGHAAAGHQAHAPGQGSGAGK